MDLQSKHLWLTLLLVANLSAGVIGWWQSIQLYQIYPRSFKDSNGDGIGDLRGISSRLGHLLEVGATAAWLSPIFQSPMKDFGYDISDFFSIAPEYGTMDDFNELIETAKSLDIRIILDFVPNHTSDQNEWFLQSANRTPGYEDYYIWHPGKVDPDDATKILPPSNWMSVFGGSAWTWSETRQEFYYHQFLAEQPDLNYRNPRVVRDMKDVLRSWLSRGAAGFRVDAVPHLFEVDPARFGGQFPDEPLSNTTENDQSYAYLDHIYTKDQPESIDMVYQWRSVLEEFTNERILILEAATELDIMMKFYGNATHEGAHFPLNFQLVDLQNPSAELVKQRVDDWLEKVPKGRVSNWVVGNHDNKRAATKYGFEISQGMIMVDLLLPGVGITYQGEEIGMTDQWISWEDTQDPAACRLGPSEYATASRDPARTPFHWDSSLSAGFSTTAETWLPVASNYKDFNLADQRELGRSYFKLYQQLSRLRRESHFQIGSLQTALLAPGVFAFGRNYYSSTYVMVVSFNKVSTRVNLRAHLDFINDSHLWVELTSSGSARKYPDSVNPNDFELTAFESLVLWGLTSEM